MKVKGYILLSIIMPILTLILCGIMLNFDYSEFSFIDTVIISFVIPFLVICIVFIFGGIEKEEYINYYPTVDINKPPIFPPNRTFTLSGETKESKEQTRQWRLYIKEYEKQVDEKINGRK